MGAPIGNRNAAGGRGRTKIKKRTGRHTFRLKTKLPKGFKKTKWKNIYEG